MPLFAKCFNPDCPCYLHWQEASGACGDCGSPLIPSHRYGEERRPDQPEMPLYFVLFKGPQPIGIPIPYAESKDDAAARAIAELAKLARFELDPEQFQVEKVFTRGKPVESL